MFIIKFICNLIESFINIYDDKGVRESYGAEYAKKLAGADPVTGKRKISVLKILYRIVILAILAFAIFMLIRINTDTGFWMSKSK